MTGYLEILGAVSIWAFFNGVLVKGIKTSGIGVGTWTALAGICTFFATFLIYGSDPLATVTPLQAIFLLQLGIFAALNNSFYYTALKISLPVAALFHYLAPLLVIFWPFIFKGFYEPVWGVDVVAALIGAVGFYWLARSSFKEGNRKLVYLGIGSAIFYSLEIVYSGYVSNKLGVPAASSSFTKLAFQVLVMPIMAISLKESMAVRGRSEWLKIVAGGILLYFSFILYFYGSATVSSLQRGILGYIDRIGAIVLGCWLFKEERAKLTKDVWIGGALIVGASAMVLIFK